MAPSEEEQLVEVDSRGRVTLGKLAGEHKRFLASADEDGTIVLRAAVVRSVVEDRLLRDPSIAKSVRDGLASEKRIRNRPLRKTTKA